MAQKRDIYEREAFEREMRKLSNGEPDWQSPAALWAWEAWQARAAIAGQQKEGSKAECWCHQCNTPEYRMTRMILCPDCGNKRCPKANDHRHQCTGSNDTGQPGSAWEHVKSAAPQQGTKGK